MPCVIIDLKAIYHVALHLIDVAVIGAYQVLNLPHVEQILGNVLFAFGLCYEHGLIRIY